MTSSQTHIVSSGSEQDDATKQATFASRSHASTQDNPNEQDRDQHPTSHASVTRDNPTKDNPSEQAGDQHLSSHASVTHHNPTMSSQQDEQSYLIGGQREARVTAGVRPNKTMQQAGTRPVAQAAREKPTRENMMYSQEAVMQYFERCRDVSHAYTQLSQRAQSRDNEIDTMLDVSLPMQQCRVAECKSRCHASSTP